MNQARTLYSNASGLLLAEPIPRKILENRGYILWEIPSWFQEGVGDTPDSYAYDGNRLRKWNVRTVKYGEVGKYVTCAVDVFLVENKIWWKIGVVLI